MFLAVPSPTMAAPNTLTATELAQRLDAGTVTAEAIVRAHLERIDRRDADVLAWSHLARPH
jgi:Asp-tRNA(Asn)/Glu-tRNA(Gln) amidotransferase A subunit family amidase